MPRRFASMSVSGHVIPIAASRATKIISPACTIRKIRKRTHRQLKNTPIGISKNPEATKAATQSELAKPGQPTKTFVNGPIGKVL